MKNEVYSTISAVLQPGSVDALKQVVTSDKINGVDLCTDVLLYNQMKTFTEAMTISGDLTVTEGDQNSNELLT